MLRWSTTTTPGFPRLLGTLKHFLHSMASTVIQQLCRLPRQPRYTDNSNTSVSVKANSTSFIRILRYTYYENKAPSFVTEVGFGPEHEEDNLLLDRHCDVSQQLEEFIFCEGDVRRFYDRYLTLALMFALQPVGVVQLSEAGPSMGTTLNTVDSSFLFLDHPLMIAELKRPYRISGTHWADPTNDGLLARNQLSQEFRM